jgi:hypothetical protein
MCYGMTQQEWEEYLADMEQREIQARQDEKEASPKPDEVEPASKVPQAFRDLELDSEVREEEPARRR